MMVLAHSARRGITRGSALLFVLWTCCIGSGHDVARAEDIASERVAIQWTSTDIFTRDTLLQRAAAAIQDGRPFLASRILAPRLADGAARTPPVLLLAAEAAAGWNGWTEVERLLVDATWLDSIADGRGRELLVRAYLERSPRARSSDSAAELHASRAIARAADRTTRGVRYALHARALDRLVMLDSAAAQYRRASELLPEIGDWLILRAAAVTRTEGERARLLANVRSTLARSRRLAAEADARLRVGDSIGAANALMLSGDTLAAYAIRLRARSPEGVEGAQVRAWLTQILTTQPGSSRARDAAELLLTQAPLTSTEYLAIARSDAISGPVDRAIRAFEGAFAMQAGTNEDRFALATLLARANRHSEAAGQFARVNAPRALAASAAYQRARSLLRTGNTAASHTLLREITRQYADIDDGSAQAHYLLGDLATDNGRDAEARTWWRQLAEKHPRHPLAQTGRFRAALAAYASGEVRTAAGEWDALVRDFPNGRERLAAEYWAGRAWNRLGLRADARQRWLSVLASEPRSYYAMRAAVRLDTIVWQAPPDFDLADWRDHPRISRRVADAAHAQMTRAAALDDLGFSPEAAFERDALFRDASAASSPTEAPAGNNEPTGAPDSAPVRSDTVAERALAAAYAFSRAGSASRAIILAERARALGLQFGAPDWRLIYPITHRNIIATESQRHGVSAALVAALIRQESRYTPSALSPAGARGLMQIMPAVGRSLASARRIAPWNDVLLYQPDVSIELGIPHLAAELRRDGSTPEYALAAYNAGRSRLVRWRAKRGSDDPELFVERIPFVETRDYVRIVLRNHEFYRVLYDLDAPAARSARAGQLE